MEQTLTVSEGLKIEIIVVAKEKNQKRTSAEILAELASLLPEGNGEKFSNCDYDKILYG